MYLWSVDIFQWGYTSPIKSTAQGNKEFSIKQIWMLCILDISIRPKMFPKMIKMRDNKNQFYGQGQHAMLQSTQLPQWPEVILSEVVLVKLLTWLFRVCFMADRLETAWWCLVGSLDGHRPLAGQMADKWLMLVCLNSNQLLADFYLLLPDCGGMEADYWYTGLFSLAGQSEINVTLKNKKTFSWLSLQNFLCSDLFIFYFSTKLFGKIHWHVFMTKKSFKSHVSTKTVHKPFCFSYIAKEINEVNKSVFLFFLYLKLYLDYLPNFPWISLHY